MWRNVEQIEEGRCLPGFHPYGWERVMSVRLDCGHTYIFQPDEPAFTNEQRGPRIGGDIDCIWCDSSFTRATKRLAGHYLVGRYVDERHGRLR
jgi:hypothetical protein